MFTQCSLLNRDSPDVTENKSPFIGNRTDRIEPHFRREHPFWGFNTDLHYLGLNTYLKMVSSEISYKKYNQALVGLVDMDKRFPRLVGACE